MARRVFERFGREVAVASAWVALLVLLVLVRPDFFSAGNIRDLLVNNSHVLIAGLGMTAVIIAGGIDISIGAQIAVCGVAAGLLAKAGLPMGAVLLLVTAVGALLGALNGALIAGARIPPIVATLATMAILREALRWATGGAWIHDLPPSFQQFGLAEPGGVPLPCWVAFLLLVGTAAALSWSRPGRMVYLVGSNPGGATLVGLEPAKVRFWTYLLMGVAAGVAAMALFPRFPLIQTNAGLGLELKVIACVVVGGTSIRGGRGTALGTLLGVGLFGTLETALTYLHVSTAWEKAVQGGVILAAVLADSLWGAGRRSRGQ